MNRDLLHLKNILDVIDSIALHQQSGITLYTVNRAVAFELVVLGEAVRQISPELKQRYPAIAWRAIGDTRNKIVHDYENVDYTIVWNIVENHLPDLKEQVLHIVKTLEAGNV